MSSIVFDNRMAGHKAKSTSERRIGDACERRVVAGKRPLVGHSAIKPQSAQPSRGHRRPQFHGSEPCSPASYVRAATVPPGGSSSAGRSAKLLCGASCGHHMQYRLGQSMRLSGVPAGYIAALAGAVTHESGSGKANPLLSVPGLRSRLRGSHGSVS